MVSSGLCIVFGRFFWHFSMSHCVAWILCMFSYMYPPCQYLMLQLYDILVFGKLFVRMNICLVCILSFIYHITLFYRECVNQTIRSSIEQYQKHFVKQFLSSLRGNWLSAPPQCLTELWISLNLQERDILAILDPDDLHAHEVGQPGVISDPSLGRPLSLWSIFIQTKNCYSLS